MRASGVLNAMSAEKPAFPASMPAKAAPADMRAGRTSVSPLITVMPGGRRVRKDLGWASEGFSAALASQMRARPHPQGQDQGGLGRAVHAAPANPHPGGSFQPLPA